MPETPIEAVLAMISTIIALVILMTPRRGGVGINPPPKTPKPDIFPSPQGRRSND